MLIELKKENLIARGGERLCFVHPLDSTKVIKVAYKDLGSRNQNSIENLYYNSLMEKNADFSHLTKFYGMVETSLGRGLVFEKVENYDKSPVVSLSQIIEKRLFSYGKIKELLTDLYNNLKKNNIIFADIGFDNIVLKKTKEDYSLVVIDGLGARHLGLKLYLGMNLGLYARYRLEKQSMRFFKKFDEAFNSAEMDKDLNRGYECAPIH